MSIQQVWSDFNGFLEGWPNGYLTAALILGAAIIVFLAITAPPLVKAAALAYIVFP